MASKGVSQEQRKKQREDEEKRKAERARARANGGNTASNRVNRQARDEKFKAKCAQSEKHTHDGERRKLRAQWQQEARKTSDKGWVPSWPVWLALYREKEASNG